MQHDIVEVSFATDARDVREGNIRANELSDILKRSLTGIAISRRKDPETMDAGATLIAVLAAPVLVELVKGPLTELAKAISSWVMKNRVNLSINDVKIENATPEQLERVLREILSVKRP